MYKIFAFISIFIRQIYLDNPFKAYFNNDNLYLKAEIIADLFNVFIGESVLYCSSFILASSIYKKGEMPSIIGSVLYLISYIFNTFLMSYLFVHLSNLKLESIFLIYFFIDTLIYIVAYKIKRIIGKNTFILLNKNNI